MRWYFSFIDKDGAITNIEEPIGWDASKLTLKRSTLHGIFYSFQQGTPYTFMLQKGGSILKEEYETNGTEGYMQLRVQVSCPSGTETVYIGRFDFRSYEYISNECKINIQVVEDDDLTIWNNRSNQKVNLESTTAFDNTTSLTPYSGLHISMQLPPKSISVQDSANSGDIYTGIRGNYYGEEKVQTDDRLIAFFLPPFKMEGSIKEIGGFDFPTEIPNALFSGYYYNERMGTSWGVPGSWEPISYIPSGYQGWLKNYPRHLLTPIFNYDDTLGDNVFPSMSINIKGDISLHVTTNSLPAGYTNLIQDLRLHLGIYRPSINATGWLSDNYSNWVFVDHLDTNGIGSPVNGGVASGGGTCHIDTTQTIYKGDMIYLFFSMQYDKAYNGVYAFDMDFTTSNFKISALSQYPATPAKVFMVNEAWSRISEAITNDKLRVKSNYFGRTDSQPYSSDADGCGSLEVLTTGGFIRQLQATRPSQPPIISLSIDDMIAGLNPIHNIGIGIEPDVDRGGTDYNRIRIENVDFFYQDDIIFSCPDVATITLKPNANEIYSTFEFGYQKWEAEQYNGIDEFLTKRIYRTTIEQNSNALQKVSIFIASGYAIEVTRRVASQSTKDWRFDNDTFIISVVRNDDGSFSVEQGGISSPSNIIDPATIYNFRISPIRNAMRWLKTVLTSYRSVDSSTSIYFTSGDGNFYASGKLGNSSCWEEEGDYTAENDRLNANIMVDTDSYRPKWYPELVTFDYPLDHEQYLAIKNHKYSRIEAYNEGIYVQGWLQQLDWMPEQQTAKFILKPVRPEYYN